MKGRLLSGDLFPKRVPTPESFFDTDHHEEMLRYHDGFDVCTPDGLLDWQRYTIDRANGRVVKRQPQSLIRISKTVRKEMREIEVAHESTLIPYWLT